MVINNNNTILWYIGKCYTKVVLPIIIEFRKYASYYIIMSFIHLNCTVINYTIIIIIIYVLNVKLMIDYCYFVCFQLTLIVSNNNSL